MLESKWREQIIQWEKVEAHETVFKTKLEAAFNSSYFDTLRDDLLGFTHVCVSEMLDHLCGQCLELTDVKKSACMDDTRVKWDQGDNSPRISSDSTNCRKTFSTKTSSGRTSRSSSK